MRQRQNCYYLQGIIKYQLLNSLIVHAKPFGLILTPGYEIVKIVLKKLNVSFTCCGQLCRLKLYVIHTLGIVRPILTYGALVWWKLIGTKWDRLMTTTFIHQDYQLNSLHCMMFRFPLQ